MDLILSSIHGSNLFGTNTAKSDKDYKGIYIPDGREIVLRTFKESIDDGTNQSNIKNGPSDIDMMTYSLCKYFKLLEKGETVALEMLFTPKEFLVTTSPLWDRIQKNKENFLHKKTLAFIGFARTQANKYGKKGERLSAFTQALDLLSSFPTWKKLKEVSEESQYKALLSGAPDLIRVVKCPSSKQGEMLDHLEICSRKFPYTVTIGYTIEALEYIIEEYGHRAIEAAQSNGTDWKAISHALRICYQGQELFRDHTMTLPLDRKHRDTVLAIKNGMCRMDFCEELLDEELAKLEDLTKKSTLPEAPNVKMMNEIIEECYSDQVTKEYTNKRKLWTL